MLPLGQGAVERSAGPRDPQEEGQSWSLPCSCKAWGISAPGARWVPLLSDHISQLLQTDQASPTASGHCSPHPVPGRTRDTRRGATTCLLHALRMGREPSLRHGSPPATSYLHEQCQESIAQVHRWEPLQRPCLPTALSAAAIVGQRCHAGSCLPLPIPSSHLEP